MTIIDEAIKEFVKNRVGGVIVNDPEGNILYQDSRILLSDKGMKLWQRKRPDLSERKTWEFTDILEEKYYRVETATIVVEGTSCQCHLFTDVSDYATLFQDISDYSSHIADLSDFQKSILSKLSQEYDSFLPELTELCKATDCVLYMIQDEKDYCRKSYYSSRLSRKRIPITKEIDELFKTKRFGFSDGYYCFLSEKTQDQSYVLFLRRGRKFNEEYFRDASVYNVVRLYIENGILREKVIYESEHDGLTGLLNKSKFLSMKETDFDRPKSVAVYYFDVNNLKQINDNLGHEAGDHLIVQASRTIHSILDEQIFGFRLGGDEFLVVAPNISLQEAKELKASWQAALDEINRTSNEDMITIACGFEFGDGNYNLDQVISNADANMYRDKKEIKAKYGLPERRS